MISVSAGRVFGFLFTFLIVAAFPLSSDAQTPEAGPLARRTVQATRLQDTERITVDGRLDEEVWQRAVPASEFIQIDPANGTPATEPTEVRIVFTKDAIYMGVTCYDSEPDKWLGYQRRRDEFLPADDRFMWTIDTFLDERSGYFFEMNPSGLMADSLFGINGDNRAWDGIWNARVRHSEIGWTIEIEIPFRTLNFDPNNDTWGFNFQRTVRRKNEDSIWMGWPRNQGLRRMTNAGHVTGITDVTQGLGLDVKPYGLLTLGIARPRSTAGARRTKANAGARSLLQPDAGTPRQPDDQHRLRADRSRSAAGQPHALLAVLPRAPRLLPRRRDVLRLRQRQRTAVRQMQPFFSRRIGLSADATPQKIDFGTEVHRADGRSGRRLPAGSHGGRRWSVHSARTSRWRA